MRVTLGVLRRAAVVSSCVSAPSCNVSVAQRCQNMSSSLTKWHQVSLSRNASTLLSNSSSWSSFVNQSRAMSGGAPDLQEVHDRVMHILRLYDKIDVSKLSETSHFINDLGLNSLDHVEVIIHIEDDFDTEIPEHVMDRLMTPDDIIQYLGDRYKVQDLQYVPDSKEEILNDDKH